VETREVTHKEHRDLDEGISDADVPTQFLYGRGNVDVAGDEWYVGKEAKCNSEAAAMNEGGKRPEDALVPVTLGEGGYLFKGVTWCVIPRRRW